METRTVFYVSVEDSPIFECVGFLNGGALCNGWEQPIFNAEQLKPLERFYMGAVPEAEEFSFDEQVTDLGNGEFVLYGWTFNLTAHPETPEGQCEYCTELAEWVLVLSESSAWRKGKELDVCCQRCADMITDRYDIIDSHRYE